MSRILHKIFEKGEMEAWEEQKERERRCCCRSSKVAMSKGVADEKLGEVEEARGETAGGVKRRNKARIKDKREGSKRVAKRQLKRQQEENEE